MSAQASSPCIAGVGSALMDMLLCESHDFLAASGALAGGMKLVEREEIDAILSTSSHRVVTAPGGSACNTIVGLAHLGATARFVGKRGGDSLGDQLETALRRGGVEPHLLVEGADTGRVLSIITPDAQRSMCTFLGASANMTPAELTPDLFAGAAIVHLEGYLLFNGELMLAALRAAKAAGALVSLDLASYTVVESSRALLGEIVGSMVDIVIANEDEARAFTGFSDERRALDVLALAAPVAVVKLGARGSLIARGGSVTSINPMGSGSAVDTTGAGDLWASGFLYGVARDFDNEQAGALASACGYEVCQVVGAQIPREGWERIRAYR